MPSDVNLTMKAIRHRQACQTLVIMSYVYLLGILSLVCASELKALYHQARQVRTLQGHEAARPLYDEILKLNPEDSTAASRIARHSSSPKRHDQLGIAGSLEEKLVFTNQLQAHNFAPDGIAATIFPSNCHKAKGSSAPLYLQPLRAGFRAPPMPSCPLDCCIQLFLLAVCLPITTCEAFLGSEMVEIIQNLGLAFEDDGWIVPYCHVMPVRVASTTLYFATDLHPNVLSMTHVGQQQEGAVMYIGPDSLALVDHWNAKQSRGADSNCVVDIGTGSGIQALTFAAVSQPSKVMCVDINPRALRLTKLNFEWNRMEAPTFVLGDIQDSEGTIYGSEEKIPWLQLLGTPTVILSNPPFLPVPVRDSSISKRYGWFSSGDASGEAILQRVVELASKCLDPSSGVLAVVSEFMNPQTNFEARLKSWWGSESRGKLLLITNQEAINADIYAERRADSSEETQQWQRHLERENITHISPGLLFARKTPDCRNVDGLEFQHELLSKTNEGSIWTPTNRFGREFTHKILANAGLLE